MKAPIKATGDGMEEREVFSKRLESVTEMIANVDQYGSIRKPHTHFDIFSPEF
jgi:hypothetical protein